MLEITAGGFSFGARFEEDAAPETVAAFRRMLPLDSKIIHVRWSGEGGWIPMGDLDVGIGPENATRYPSPGELIFYPGGVSETELLLAYGYVAFASKAGALAGNHFATIVSGNENLRELGRRMLWDGAQDIVVQRVVARRASASASTSIASATSSSDESSSGEWLTPPLRLRTKSIAASTPAVARIPASCPAPEASSTSGSPRASTASRSACRRVPGEACRLDAVGRDETDRGDERVEPLDIRRADVEAEPDSRRNHVRAAGLDVELSPPWRRHRGSPGRITHALDLACGRDERVLTADHRRRSGMPRTPVEDELPAGIPDDSGHDSDRHVSFGQHGSLLDVELEKRPRKRPASRDAARGFRRIRPPPRERPRRSRHRRARPPRSPRRRRAPRRSGRPGGRCRGASRPSRHRRPARPHVRRGCRGGRPRPRAPPPRASVAASAMRLVLGRGGMRSVRAGAAADRVQLVEPLERRA